MTLRRSGNGWVFYVVDGRGVAEHMRNVNVRLPTYKADSLAKSEG